MQLNMCVNIPQWYSRTMTIEFRLASQDVATVTSDRRRLWSFNIGTGTLIGTPWSRGNGFNSLDVAFTQITVFTGWHSTMIWVEASTSRLVPYQDSIQFGLVQKWLPPISFPAVGMHLTIQVSGDGKCNHGQWQRRIHPMRRQVVDGSLTQVNVS